MNKSSSLQKVVLSGAGGFVGQALLQQLSSDYRVVALSRAPEKLARRLRVQAYAWRDLDQALRCAHAVVHLSGAPAVGRRWSPETKKEIVDSRVESTRQLVNAMADQPELCPRVFICASAVGYYGCDSSAERKSESSSPGSDFLAQLCVDWEREASRASELGVRTLRLRFGIVLGRGGGALEEMVKPFRLGFGGPLGSGDQMISWISLRDVVSIIERGLTDERYSGAINAVAPHPVSSREFARVLGDCLSRPSWFRAPSFALRLRFGEGADPLLGGQAVEPQALRDLGYAFALPDLDGALREALATEIRSQTPKNPEGFRT